MITTVFGPPPSASGATGAGVEVATACVTAVAGGTGVNVAAGMGVAVGGTGVAVGTAVGANVAVGLGVAVAGLGVAVGMAVGTDVAVGLGVAVAGRGVAVGMAVGTDVAVGTGVAVAGLGVAVGMAVGTDVAVGTGVAVGTAVGVAVGGASSITMTYVLKFVSVVTAHTAPEASVSQRCSSSVHSSPLTRYTRTRPSAHAAASAAGSANRRSTPGEYVIGVGVLLPDANVSNSAASTTRSASAGGAPGASASSFVKLILTFDGTAPSGTTCTVESSVVIGVGSGVGVGVIAVVGPFTLSVTNTIRGVFSAAGALMAILPRYVPASKPEAFADTRTVTRACGLFDDADLGENDSQLASADTVNGMSVCRSVFHTVNVCDGGASPPRAAVNVRKFVDRPTSGRGGSGVAVGLGVAVTVGVTSSPSPSPPSPPSPPPIGVAVGMSVSAGVGVIVGVAVAVGMGVSVGVGVIVGVAVGAGAGLVL